MGNELGIPGASGPEEAKEIHLKDEEYTVKLNQSAGPGVIADNLDGTHNASQIPVLVKRFNETYNTEGMTRPQLKELFPQAEKLKPLCENCPNLVAYLDYAVEYGRFWLITEHCPMGDLEVYLKNNGAMEKPRAAVFMDNMASGLKFLHEQNPPIAHRRVKLHNVLVYEHHGTHVLKLSDYALSDLLPDVAAAHDQFYKDAKTIQYMPPEFFQDGYQSLSVHGDIYALGLVFQILLTYDGSASPLIPGSVDGRRMSVPQPYAMELLMSANLKTERPKLFATAADPNHEAAALLLRLQGLVQDMTSCAALERPTAREVCGTIVETLTKDEHAAEYFTNDKEVRITECKKATANFLKLFNQWEAERKDVIKFLETVSTEQHTFHKSANFSNVLGSSVGIFGTAMFVGGVVAAPFTMGTSLLVSKVGAGIGLAGGMTTVGATAGEMWTEKSGSDTVQARVGKHGDKTKALVDLGAKIKFLSDEITRLETMFPSETPSIETVKIASLSSSITAWLTTSDAILGKSTIMSLGQLTKLALLVAHGAKFLIGLGAIVDVYNIMNRTNDINAGSRSQFGEKCTEQAGRLHLEMEGFRVFYEAVKSATQAWKDELESLTDTDDPIEEEATVEDAQKEEAEVLSDLNENPQISSSEAEDQKEQAADLTDMCEESGYASQEDPLVLNPETQTELATDLPGLREGVGCARQEDPQTKQTGNGIVGGGDVNSGLEESSTETKPTDSLVSSSTASDERESRDASPPGSGVSEGLLVDLAHVDPDASNGVVVGEGLDPESPDKHCEAPRSVTNDNTSNSSDTKGTDLPSARSTDQQENAATPAQIDDLSSGSDLCSLDHAEGNHCKND